MTQDQRWICHLVSNVSLCGVVSFLCLVCWTSRTCATSYQCPDCLLYWITDDPKKKNHSLVGGVASWAVDWFSFDSKKGLAQQCGFWVLYMTSGNGEYVGEEVLEKLLVSSNPLFPVSPSRYTSDSGEGYSRGFLVSVNIYCDHLKTVEKLVMVIKHWHTRKS